MCDEAVDKYVHALEFVPELYKTQKKCVIKLLKLFLLYLILYLTTLQILNVCVLLFISWFEFLSFDSVGSTISWKDYLPLISKASLIHMHEEVVLV